jgi:hypothetical protein
MLPELAPASIAARLLFCRALLHVQAGERSAALEDLRLALTLAQQVESTGIEMAVAIAISIRSAYFRVAQLIASDPKFDQELLDGMLGLMPLMPDEVDLTSPLREMAYSSVWSLRNVGRLPEEGFPKPWRMSEGIPGETGEWERFAWTMPRVRAEATLLGLEYWSEVLGTYDKDDPDVLAWARRVSTKAPRGSGFSQAAEVLADALTPRILNLASNAQEQAAQSRVLESALRVFAQRGRDVEEALLSDPFSSSKLRYKKTPDGFLVYSLGADGTDEGGRALRTPGSDRVDIVFQYPYKRRVR